MSVVLAVLLTFFAVGDHIPRLARWLFFPGAQPIDAENWDVFMISAYGRHLQVTAADGKEFKGVLLSFSTDKERKSVRLGDAHFVNYAQDGTWLGDTPLGESLLLEDSEVRRVLLLPVAV